MVTNHVQNNYHSNISGPCFHNFNFTVPDDQVIYAAPNFVGADMEPQQHHLMLQQQQNLPPQHEHHYNYYNYNTYSTGGSSHLKDTNDQSQFIKNTGN